MIVECINGTESINIEISITNNSTLDLRNLNAYFVCNDKTIQDVDAPIWQYDDIIKCDGVTRHLMIKDVHLNNPGIIYLTDENKYVISELNIHNESGINYKIDNNERQFSFHDLRGIKVETPMRGFYLFHKDGKTIKIIK